MDISKLIVTKIDLITTVVYDNPTKLQMKHRPGFGLSFATCGKIIFRHKDKEYLLDQNHALFYPKHATYELDCQMPGLFTLVNFDCAEDDAFDEFVSMKVSESDHYLKNHVLLEKLDYVNKPYHLPNCLSLIYDTFSHLQESLQKEKTFPVLRPAISYITEHLADPALSNSELSAYLDISDVYFRKLFKESFGISPGQYIQNQRLEKAKELLTTSQLSVTQISAECGYTSIYHFCRMFKQHTGYTPSAFRELYRNNCL